MGDLLALRQKTKVDKTIDTIPKPPHYLPPRKFPGWEKLSLYSKLPRLKWPPNEIIYSRNKLGRAIFNVKTDGLYVAPPDSKYEPLHDIYLRDFFFRNKKRLKQLREMHLINEDNEVFCSMKRFNEYRMYLASTRLDKIRNEWQREEELKNHIKFLDMVEAKEARHQKWLTKQKRCNENLQKQRRAKLSARRRKQENDSKRNERKKMAHLKNEIGRRQKIMNHGMKFQRIRYRHWQLKAENQMKMSEFGAKMQSDDLKRQERLQTEETMRKNKQSIDDLCNWILKIHNAIQTVKYHEEVLKQNELQQKLNKERRERDVKLHREELQQKILKKKMKIIQSRYEQKTVENLVKTIISEIVRHAKFQKIRQSSISCHPKHGIFYPYETKEISEAGLRDPPTGYASLNRDQITLVVNSCANLETKLKAGCPNTMTVLLNVRRILHRIIEKQITELPKDQYVWSFVYQRVEEILTSIEVEINKKIKEMLSIENRNESRMEEKRTPKNGTSVNFQDNITSIVHSNTNTNTSESEEPVSKSSPKENDPEKMTKLRFLIRATLFSGQNDDDDLELPNGLQGDNLYHLSRQQKLLVASNLEFFESTVLSKVEQMVFSTINCTANCKKSNKKSMRKNKEELVSRMVISILTPPEYDSNLADNLIGLSEYLNDRILSEMKKDPVEFQIESKTPLNLNTYEPVIDALLDEIERYRKTS